MSTDAHRRKAAGHIARCAICSVSDTRTFATDRGGSLIRDVLKENEHEIVSYEIVRDEPKEIRDYLETTLEKEVDVIIFTGGTGVSSRDGTPDVVAPFFDRELHGFGELFRMLSYDDIGAAAFLSRAIGGVVGRTAVFCLPGSPAAVRLAMDKLLLPELPHLVSELKR